MYGALEQSNEDSSMPARKSHSRERTARTPVVVERTQALILDNPGQSLRKLASIISVSEPTMRRNADKDLRYKSYTLKIRQRLPGQVELLAAAPILASQQPRFKSLGLLRMERSS